MDRIIKQTLFFALLLFLGSFKPFCQEKISNKHSILNSIPKEKVFLHSNTNLLLTGEMLYYKLYCLLDKNNKFSGISKIGYVELVSSNNKIVFKHKLNLNKGKASGDFFIPSSIKTGNYKLIAYTKWGSNNKLNRFAQKDIYIVNPFVSSDDFSANPLQNSDSVINIGLNTFKKNDPINKYGISLITNSSTYKKRNKVVLDIDNLLGEINYGEFSISVRKVDSVKVSNENSFQKIEPDHRQSINLPEIRGEIISGQVLSIKDNSAVSNKIVALSIAGGNYIYKNVKTNNFGKFYFNLFENYKSGNAIVTVIDPDKHKYKVILDNSSIDYHNKLKFNTVKLNPNIKYWLLQRSIHNQIESAYYKNKKDSIVNRELSQSFYTTPSVEYLLDDYTRFSTIRETFVEIIKEASVRKNKESFDFIVHDYENTKYNLSLNLKPLILVDGIPIQNNEDILNYNSSDIESIRIVKEIYFYGSSVFDGIIDFKTKKGDFNISQKEEFSKEIRQISPESVKIYYSPDYEIESNILAQIPDFRTQLLWRPNISLNGKTKRVTFYSSDIKGEYEIFMEGYTFNGKYISIKKIIEVL